ncbi:MAG: type II toxin-antitoxin system RelE/ParE family toxin [Fuerstiella sp.]
MLVSDQAVDDVIRNANWWSANHSQDKALEWQIAIFEKIYALDMMPESKPLAFENPGFSYEIREALFGLGSRPGYRILFTVVDDTVNVLTVKAAEEDWVTPDELPKSTKSP